MQMGDYKPGGSDVGDDRNQEDGCRSEIITSSDGWRWEIWNLDVGIGGGRGGWKHKQGGGGGQRNMEVTVDGRSENMGMAADARE